MASYIPSYKNIITRETISTISMRYKTITKAINKEFWNSDSDTAHSLYVGSYGRRTAISTSDLDVLVELPEIEYMRYDNYSFNGQSKLLQTVKSAIKSHYYNTDIRADGQVVKVSFSDGIKFEILPAFKNFDGTYKYPDTNMGGNWLSTNPKAEQSALKYKDNISNRLLSDTCRHIRYIRDNYFKSYHLSGIVIDTFVYDAIGDWHRPQISSLLSPPIGTYEKELYNYWRVLTK